MTPDKRAVPFLVRGGYAVAVHPKLCASRLGFPLTMANGVAWRTVSDAPAGFRP